jgi:hypothetical protein
LLVTHEPAVLGEENATTQSSPSSLSQVAADDSVGEEGRCLRGGQYRSLLGDQPIELAGVRRGDVAHPVTFAHLPSRSFDPCG